MLKWTSRKGAVCKYSQVWLDTITTREILWFFSKVMHKRSLSTTKTTSITTLNHSGWTYLMRALCDGFGRLDSFRSSLAWQQENTDTFRLLHPPLNKSLWNHCVSGCIIYILVMVVKPDQIFVFWRPEPLKSSQMVVVLWNFIICLHLNQCLCASQDTIGKRLKTTF